MRLTALALVAALLASGCGGSKDGGKKAGQKGPHPVAEKTVPGGGPPDKGTKVEVREVPKDPVKPPDPKPEPVKPIPPPPDSVMGQNPGDRARELALQDADGKPFTLTQYRGEKAVLLVFGATWCPNCKAALPEARAAHENFGGKGLVVAEVFLGEDQKPEAVKAYAKEQGLGYLLLPDLRQLSRSKYRYEVPDMPMHVLIGKDGRVVASGRKVPSAAEIEKALK
ncbi:MAG: TlpA family protein disulfide reductase [Candidatus Brocadiae bacterium]|nr:TlpA family protein disulfide reductase [Candidatus Brocadiia bacterium]